MAASLSGHAWSFFSGGLTEAEYLRKLEREAEFNARERERRAAMSPAARKKENRRRFWEGVGAVGVIAVCAVGTTVMIAGGIIGIGTMMFVATEVVKFVTSLFC